MRSGHPFRLIFFFVSVIVNIAASRYNETSLVLRDIFTSYDKRVLPYVNGPVVVNMTIVLGILIELVIVPQDMVWMPKLFVYNSLETKEMLTMNRADVRVFSTGLVKANLPQHVSCICRLSIENFPFDVQFCAVALAAPLLTVNEMRAIAFQPPVDSYFAGNAEWLLYNVTVRQMEFLEENEYRIEVHYIFHMQRRPIYYLTVIVAPIFLISALSILGIFSPASNSGPRSEKVSLGLGSLLAMTVLLGIVAGAMPKSNEIPLLGYYILIVICLCAVAVAISMAFLALTREYITRDQPPSKTTLSKLRMQSYRKVNRVPRHSCITTITPDFSKYKVPELGMILHSLEEIVDAQKSAKAKQDQRLRHREIEEEWARVFARFDYFFLFIFQSLNIGALGIFLRVAWLPLPDVTDRQLL